MYLGGLHIFKAKTLVNLLFTVQENFEPMKNPKRTNLIKIYRANLQVWVILLLASVLASLARIPYVSAILYQKTSPPPMSSILRSELLNFVVLILPTVSLGLWLGSKVGLDTSKIKTVLLKAPGTYRRFQSSILTAVILGTVGGIFILAISALSRPFMPSEMTDIEHPSFFPSLLGSFGAAVSEEIWLRLGLMSCLVWLLSKLMRQLKPDKILIWSANFLAALGFGMLHLPLAFASAKESSAFVVVFILSLNSFIGVIFGWLYWRRGLLAAMIAHFSTNAVIHVIPALLLTGIG